MAKNKTVIKQQQDEDVDVEFDFSDFLVDSPDEEAMAGMMGGLLEASQQQLQIAMELTRLVVEKNAAESLKEKDIFAVFKRAAKVVADSSPMKELWDR